MGPAIGTHGVGPVAGALARDRQQGVRDARPQVSRRVDGVAGGTTQAGTDADHEQRDGQRAELGRGAAEGDHHEDQHEGADHLGGEVPDVVAQLGAGGEDRELELGLGLLVEVALVGQPAEHRADEGPDHLGHDVEDGVAHRRVHSRGELVGPVGQQADRDGRVDVGTRLEGDEHPREDREAPPEVDHQESAAEPLGLGQDPVGDHPTTEQQQHRRAQHLRDEHSTHQPHSSSLLTSLASRSDKDEPPRDRSHARDRVHTVASSSWEAPRRRSGAISRAWLRAATAALSS